MPTLEPVAALRAALGAYLRAELDPEVVVLDEWPQPGRTRQQRVVSIVSPGGVQKVTAHLPRKLSFVPVDADTGTYSYSYGLAEVALQLDAWAENPSARDQLVAALQAKLNRPPSATLGGTALPRASRQQGLVLRVTNFFSAPCSYVFDFLPRLPESSSIAQAGAHRGTFTGMATMFLVNEDVVPILKSIVGLVSVNGGAQQSVPLSE